MNIVLLSVLVFTIILLFLCIYVFSKSDKETDSLIEGGTIATDIRKAIGVLSGSYYVVSHAGNWYLVFKFGLLSFSTNSALQIINIITGTIFANNVGNAWALLGNYAAAANPTYAGAIAAQNGGGGPGAVYPQSNVIYNLTTSEIIPELDAHHVNIYRQNNMNPPAGSALAAAGAGPHNPAAFMIFVNSYMGLCEAYIHDCLVFAIDNTPNGNINPAGTRTVIVARRGDGPNPATGIPRNSNPLAFITANGSEVVFIPFNAGVVNAFGAVPIAAQINNAYTYGDAVVANLVGMLTNVIDTHVNRSTLYDNIVAGNNSLTAGNMILGGGLIPKPVVTWEALLTAAGPNIDLNLRTALTNGIIAIAPMAPFPVFPTTATRANITQCISCATLTVVLAGLAAAGLAAPPIVVPPVPPIVAPRVGSAVALINAINPVIAANVGAYIGAAPPANANIYIGNAISASIVSVILARHMPGGHANLVWICNSAITTALTATATALGVAAAGVPAAITAFGLPGIADHVVNLIKMNDMDGRLAAHFNIGIGIIPNLNPNQV